jgi:hypothetical protein
MRIAIELSAESHALVLRHFKEVTDLHTILQHAARRELAGIEVCYFEIEPLEAEALLQWRAIIVPRR